MHDKLLNMSERTCLILINKCKDGLMNIRRDSEYRDRYSEKHVQVCIYKVASKRLDKKHHIKFVNQNLITTLFVEQLVIFLNYLYYK